MTISIFRYSLEAKESLYSAKGALLRVNFEDQFGYMDLHPVVSWGDPPLEEVLMQLEHGESTTLIDRALHFARLDHMARAKKQSIFKEKKSSFKNHFLILRDQIDFFIGRIDLLRHIAEEGFTTIKVKVPPDVWRTIEIVEKLSSQGFRLRLDFNGQFDQSQFLEFLKRCTNLLPHIDYIEDPFSFDVEKWSEIQSQFPVSLALDKGSEKGVGLVGAAKVLIVKPLRQNELDFFFALAHGQRIVVTSMMDHPLGQLAAAFAASKFVQETHGIFAHRVYKETPFSALLEGSAPYLTFPSGEGFGFDKLLEALPWTPL